MLDFDLRVIESGRGALFPLRRAVIDRERRVGFRRMVLERHYFPVRAHAAVLCSSEINRDRSNVVCWYPYDFTAGGRVHSFAAS